MPQGYNCPGCSRVIVYGSNPCPRCNCALAWSQQGPVVYHPPSVSLQEAQPPTDLQPKPINQVAISNKLRAENTKILKMIALVIGGLLILLALTYVIFPNQSPNSVSNSPPDTATEQGKYITKLSVNCNDMDGYLMPVLLALAKPDTTSSSWRLTCSLRTAMLGMAIDEGKLINAPASLIEIENAHRQALVHFEKGVDLVQKGLKDYDNSLIYQGTAEIELGAPYYVETKDLLKKAKDSRGIK